MVNIIRLIGIILIGSGIFYRGKDYIYGAYKNE